MGWGWGWVGGTFVLILPASFRDRLIEEEIELASTQSFHRDLLLVHGRSHGVNIGGWVGGPPNLSGGGDCPPCLEKRKESNIWNQISCHSKIV